MDYSLSFARFFCAQTGMKLRRMNMREVIDLNVMDHVEIAINKMLILDLK
jgi:hypothetical protein